MSDCLTPNTDFSNSNDLSSSLSNGFLYAKLVNESIPTTYNFCLQVSASPFDDNVENL